MARWRGTTTQRGYGQSHVKIRNQLLARWQPGDPCARCRQPMWGPPSEIHLGHTSDRTGYTGLEHKQCNTIDGAQRGNQRNGFKPAAAGANVICRTCGQPYHYTARLCEMCGRHYHPSRSPQRSCSRACGVELRRRNGTLSGPRFCACGQPCPPRKPYCPTCLERMQAEAESRRAQQAAFAAAARVRECPECGQEFTSSRGGPITCGEECARKREQSYKQRYMRDYFADPARHAPKLAAHRKWYAKQVDKYGPGWRSARQW